MWGFVADKEYTVLTTQDLESDSERRSNAGHNYRVEGDLPEGAKIITDGDVMITGSMHDNSSIISKGHVLVMESIGQGCHVVAQSVNAYDVGPYSSIETKGGDIKVNCLGSRVRLISDNGMVSFTDAGPYLKAITNGSIHFKSAANHAFLEGKSIHGGGVRNHGDITSNEGDVDLLSIGDHGKVVSAGKVILKSRQGHNTEIIAVNSASVLPASHFKPGMSYELENDTFIDGDLPSNVTLKVKGDLTVLGDIGQRSLINATGKVTFDETRSTIITASAIKGGITGSFCRLISTEGDITLDKISGGTSITCKGDLRIKRGGGTGIKVRCDGLNYAENLLSGKELRISKAAYTDIGCGITYDAATKTYDLPTYLMVDPKHNGFTPVQQSLKTMGANFQTAIVGPDGVMEEGYFIIMDKASKELEQKIRTELNEYVTRFGGHQR